MTNRTFEVAVVSAFGRGELLAAELQTRGMNAALIDVSKGLVERQLADIEGPFPIVRPQQLLPAHLEWLMSHSFSEVSTGFSIWLKDGPIEFRGPLMNHYASRSEMRYFHDHFSLPSPTSPKAADKKKKLASVDFRERWLVEFAHSFAACEFHRSMDAHLVGEAYPFHQPQQMPFFSPTVMQKIHEGLRATGLEWIEADGIGEISVERDRLDSVEIRVGGTNTIRSRYYVWCLSSEETEALSRKTAQSFFKRVASADWAWRRFPVHSAKNALENVIPPYMVLIDDIHFPWAYDNFVILKRRKSGLSDLWVRLPSEKSKKPEQLEKTVIKLSSLLKARFLHWQHEIEAPWDEGPPLYPLFETEKLRAFGKVRFANVVYEGAEVLKRQDWAGRFQKQAESMLLLQMMKNKDMAKTKKEKTDDPALYAP